MMDALDPSLKQNEGPWGGALQYTVIPTPWDPLQLANLQEK